MMLRTGILMPRSTLYPAIGIDMLNGLKACLQYLGLTDSIKLHTENIGFGTNEQEIYAKAEKMLLEEDVDIVIAVADARVAEMLEPLFTASNKLLLTVNFGANFPASWQPAPTTITHSMNFAFHTWLTGKYAAAKGYHKVANTIGYYDGGYSQCYAMLNGHQKAGGIPAFNHVTPLKTADFNLGPLHDFLTGNTDVNALLCLFSGDTAILFYDAIKPIQAETNVTLFVAPMMLDESLTTMPGGSTLTLKDTMGFCPWHSTFNHPANTAFVHQISQAYHKKANLFSLLGWETALLLQTAIHAFTHMPGNAAHAVAEMCSTSYDSPRGWLKIDAATHHSYGPSRLISATADMQLSIVETLEDTDSEWKSFTGESLPTGESSSWRNTYLCI